MPRSLLMQIQIYLCVMLCMCETVILRRVVANTLFARRDLCRSSTMGCCRMKLHTSFKSVQAKNTAIRRESVYSARRAALNHLHTVEPPCGIIEYKR